MFLLDFLFPWRSHRRAMRLIMINQGAIMANLDRLNAATTALEVESAKILLLIADLRNVPDQQAEVDALAGRIEAAVANLTAQLLPVVEAPEPEA